MVKKQNQKNYDKIIKVFQVAAAVFMVAMVAVMLVLMNKYNIKVSNAAEISTYITGGTFTVACIIIVFSVVKSFALVFPPALIFAVSGILFENYWVAVLVNFIATALSLFLPYFMGKFTGESMVNTLTKRFPKIKKLDDFAGSNEVAVVFVVKASGIVSCDISSLIFGAMNINFTKYIIASNLGMLPFNFLWTLLGHKGDLSNPLSLLYVLPIPVFAVVASLLVKKISAKKS